MKKTAALLLIVGCHFANAEGPSQVILQCDGEQWGEGISAPKDAYVPSRESNVDGVYTMQGDALVESLGGKFPDQRYMLCSATGTNYVFSSDCTVARRQYVSDWLASTDVDPSTGPFSKKYPNSVWGLQTVTVNRVSLRLEEELLMGYVRSHYDQKLNSFVYAPFLVSTRYAAGCKLEKPKI
jgi:hypothetical protein